MDRHVDRRAGSADLGRRRHDRMRSLEQVAHAVAAGHVPERAVLELAREADQRALAVGLDAARAAERLDQARRHLAAERLERFHHRLDVFDVAARVGVLEHRGEAAAAQRLREARAVVVPDVLDGADEFADVDGGKLGGSGKEHGRSFRRSFSRRVAGRAAGVASAPGPTPRAASATRRRRRASGPAARALPR